MPNRFELLKQNPLFDELDDIFIDQFAQKAEERLFSQDDVLMTESVEGNDIFMVVDGQARLEIVLSDSDAPNQVISIGKGELIGQLRFFGQSPPAGTVMANGDLTTLRWNADDWRSICESHPESGYKIAMRIGASAIERLRGWCTSMLNNVSWGLGM